MTVATYTLPALQVGFSTNKCMASIFNSTGSGKTIKIYRVWALNNQMVAVTGVLTNLELRKISASSGGTLIQPTPHDFSTQTLVGAPVLAAQAVATISTAAWGSNVITVTTGSGSANTVAAGTTWANNIGSITTGSAHGYVVGQVVTIASVNPSGFNGTYVILSVPSTTTFTVSIGSSPGAYVSGGTTNAGHSYQVNNLVAVTGVTPSGYNGNYVVATVPSSTTFTVANNSNPGAYSSGGSVAPLVIIGTNQTVTPGALYRRTLWSTDEPVTGGAAVAVSLDELQCLLPFGCLWSLGYGDTTVDPITLAEGEGIAILNTGAAVGLADFFIEFTIA